MAAFSVPATSGFAALLNPMWLSLICTKLSSPAATFAGHLRHLAHAVGLQDSTLHDAESDQFLPTPYISRIHAGRRHRGCDRATAHLWTSPVIIPPGRYVSAIFGLAQFRVVRGHALKRAAQNAERKGLCAALGRVSSMQTKASLRFIPSDASAGFFCEIQEIQRKWE